MHVTKFAPKLPPFPTDPSPFIYFHVGGERGKSARTRGNRGSQNYLCSENHKQKRYIKENKHKKRKKGDDSAVSSAPPESSEPDARNGESASLPRPATPPSLDLTNRQRDGKAPLRNQTPAARPARPHLNRRIQEETQSTSTKRRITGWIFSARRSASEPEAGKLLPSPSNSGSRRED